MSQFTLFPDDEAASRICTACKLPFPATPEYFYRTRGTLFAQCKPCTKVQHAAYYAANKEKVKARETARLERARQRREADGVLSHGAYSRKACSVEGCDQQSRTLGFCHRHYWRFRKYGEAGQPERLRTINDNADGHCLVDGCQRQQITRGWCRNHYRRWLDHGDVGSAETQSRPWVLRFCTVQDCQNEARVRSLCSVHYARWRVHGDPEKGARKEPQGFINAEGYRMISVDGIWQVPEHRLVMEQMIGRSLAPEETVHHRNGVRTDNRPSNLELWCSRHPSGQRVDDLVDWALEILNTYGQICPREGDKSVFRPTLDLEAGSGRTRVG